MLRSLRLQNFRSLRDTGDVELRPIIVLVGANSSGKSSFLRFFPLLKQTTQAKSRSPLLWFGEERGLVDFQDFENTLSRGATVPEIIVSGRLKIPLINGASESAECQFHSHITAEEGRSFVRRFQYECMDEEFVACFASNRSLTSLALTGLEAVIDLDGQVIFDNLVPDFTITDINPQADELLHDRISQHTHRATGMDKIEDIAESIRYGSAGYVQQTMLEVYGGAKKWIENVQALDPSDPYIQEIKRLAFLRALGGRGPWDPMAQLSSALSDLAHGVRYIGPFRRAPARFYRQQEVSVDEIDATGSNLAMFLYSLEERDRSAFSSWVYEHFGFNVRAERRDAQVVLRVNTGTKSNFDLTDMGFGISQLLPVAAQCWLSSQRRSIRHRNSSAPSLLAIEQPELHLHPHHQFQLADMFMGLANAARDTQQPLTLCIETHSEAMIHRFGELVAEDPRRREDITVLFFEKAPDSDTSTVRQIQFDAEGVLQNWPIGFFRG